MATDYRALKPEEQAEAMDLWTGVFNVSAGFFTSLLDSQHDRILDQTRLAVVDSKIVSGLHFFYLPTRGMNGEILRMGGIANVATYDEARRQGHSGRLLQDAIAQMEQDGCAWSMLFTGVNQHYARYGWKTITTHSRKGQLRKDFGSDKLDLRIEPLTDVWSALPDLKAVHDAFDRNRPLTMVRSLRAWQTAAYFRIHGSTVFVAKEGEAVVGYAIAKVEGKQIQVMECASSPERPEILLSLFSSIRDAAAQRGIEDVWLPLPEDPAVDAAIDRLATDIHREDHGHVMGRPIGDRMSMEQVEALFTAPGAIYWQLDNF